MGIYSHDYHSRASWMMDIIIALLLAVPLFAFFYFVIIFGYGEWAIMYLIILTVLCYQAWRVGDK